MTLFDPYRKSTVKATPEECVRSRLLHYMTEKLGYPKHLLVVEKQLSQLPGCAGAPDRRLDIICFAKGAKGPLLLIECKAGHVGEGAKEQLLGYNHYVKAPYVALAGQDEIKTGYFDAKKCEYVFVTGLPRYEELC